MISFADLLSRADMPLLDSLLPKGSAPIIREIDKSLNYTSNLSRLIMNLVSPQGLLLNQKSRNLLIDILPESHAVELSELMGSDRKQDSYVYLKNLKLNRTEDKVKFLKFFGQDFFEELIEARPDIELIESEYPLFSHQISALGKVRDFLSKDGGRVLLHMPTGSGKTRTAINFASEFLRFKSPRIVVWLANSEELCDQAASEFLRAWNYLGNRKVNLYRCWGEHDTDLSEVKDGFLIIGLAKALSKIKSHDHGFRLLSAKDPLVIFDEAHQAVANTYKLITELLVRPMSAARLLGLSATPGRSLDDINRDEELSNFFNKNKVTLKIDGYDNPVSYLIDRGYLAKPTFRRLMSEQDINLNDSNKAKMLEILDLPLSVLNELGSNQKRNLLIVSEAERLAKNHTRIIIFSASLEQSDILATVLTARGFDAKSITSRTTTYDRTRAIEKFKAMDSNVKILCNYGILTTGFDAPKTSAALIARPTLSLVLYSQMVGRAIRGRLAGGNDFAEIVTVIDDGIEQFNSIEAAFSNWEDVWQDD